MNEADILKAASLIHRRKHSEARIKELQIYCQDGATNHYITLNGTKKDKTVDKIFREITPEEAKALTEFLIVHEQKYLDKIQGELYLINS